MSAMQRRKGANGEREAAAALTAIGISAERTARNGVHDAPDVTATGLRVEVKRRRRMIHHSWMGQALATRGCDTDVVAVMSRPDGGEWLVTVRLSDLIRMSHLVRATAAESVNHAAPTSAVGNRATA